MKFSQRMGFSKTRTRAQIDGMNEELRNSLWNVLDEELWSSRNFLRVGGHMSSEFRLFSRRLWSTFFKLPADQRPAYPDQILKVIRVFFFERKWYEIYDFLEFCAKHPGNEQLSLRINQILERELSGYRMVGQQVVPICHESELDAIEKAVFDSPYEGTRAHLSRALSLLSDRKKPDYRNSIKESISAVESTCRELTQNPNATLGDALRNLERSHSLHGALGSGFRSIYGYTSDADGIRHGMLEEPALSQADAKFFLVACAALVNYLIDKDSSLKKV